MASSSTPPPPQEKAAEIINKLPSSPSLITKTGTALLGTGLAAAAISQELYVVNEETVLLVASAVFFTYVAKVRIGSTVQYASFLTYWHRAGNSGSLL